MSDWLDHMLHTPMDQLAGWELAIAFGAIFAALGLLFWLGGLRPQPGRKKK